MKENPENINSGFFLQKISFIIFESEERFQFVFDKPKEVSEQLTSFLSYFTCFASSSCAFLLDSSFSFIHLS